MGLSLLDDSRPIDLLEMVYDFASNTLHIRNHLSNLKVAINFNCDETHLLDCCDNWSYLCFLLRIFGCNKHRLYRSDKNLQFTQKHHGPNRIYGRDDKCLVNYNSEKV